MKKFGKTLFGILSVAAAAGGAYCLLKKKLNNDADFDDFDEEDDEFVEDIVSDSDNREYVSIQITPDTSSDVDVDKEAVEDVAEAIESVSADIAEAEKKATEE